MRLIFISDTHEQHEKLGKLPDGDILIHAGDFSYNGSLEARKNFLNWFQDQPHRHKVFIAGNHDFKSPQRGLCADQTHYLYDSGVDIGGVKFWGSPYTPRFFDWAFMYDTPTDRWNQIPDDTDVLITHGPPHGILDRPFGRKASVGCQNLRNRVMDIKPSIHVFGHIHGDSGCRTYCGVTFINASVVNEAYDVVNRPVVVDYKGKRMSYEVSQCLRADHTHTPEDGCFEYWPTQERAFVPRPK